MEAIAAILVAAVLIGVLRMNRDIDAHDNILRDAENEK
jgi:hypothetical protein